MRKQVILTMAVIFWAQLVSAASYYVSKSGSDSNAGTSTNTSFLTIQKAASLMNAGDTCYILSGTYRESVTPANSGTSNAPITFAAYPGAVPIVSGADLLNLSWNVYTGSIYQANTALSFRQLFVDGRMMNEARWPNAVVDDLLHAQRSTPQTCTYTNLVDSSLPNINLVGAMLHIFPNEYNNQGYAANTRQITGWNPATKTISWSGNIFNTGAINTLYYIYGTLPLLDTATEWVLTGNVLYLWTPDNASPASHVVEAKTRSSAFTLDNRSYVTVTGINVFAAGISMANTTSCVVDNCNLIYVQHNTTADWTVSVPIANQVSGNGSIWKNSTINFSSQDGIRCTGQNEVVSNCVILNVDYYPGTYYASVTTYTGGNGTRIVHNTFQNSGRYLVGVASTSADISYNDLGYGELLTSDGGATYVYVGAGNGAGTAIHNNWAHNSWAGVYVDAFQNNYFVYRNLCWSNYVGMLFNQFSNNLIINNTTVSNTASDIQFNGGSDTGVQLINNLWRTTQNTYGSTVLASNGWYPPLGTNYVPQSGSAAINGGMVYSPYTDGFIGPAPDVGAYEVGGEYWIPGASFSAQPFPNPYALPFITTQPVSQTNYPDQIASFSVTATSALPLSYWWQSGTNGVYTNLFPGGGGPYAGVTNATLYIFVSPEFAGDYRVILTNANGATTSSVASLTVLPDTPSIAVQPTNQTIIVGQTAAFSVTALGLAPLRYQWQAGVTNSGGPYTNLIAGGQFSAVTNATLTVSNVGLGNAADFVVVVTNSSGAITSTVATLTVVTVPPYQILILADHPVAYWPIQETTGPTIHDIVGGYDGTLMTSIDGSSLGLNQHTNFATGGAVSSDGATYLFGGPGLLPGDAALYFTNLDGSVNNSQIVVPYNTAIDPGSNVTAEAWIEVPTYPIGYAKTTFQTVLGLEANGGAGNGWWMGVEADSSGFPGDVQFNAAKYPGLWLSPAPTSTASLAGQWVHAVEVYTGSNSNLLCYTNGVLMKTVTMTSSYDSEGIYGLHKLPFIIGSYCASYNGGGTLATGFERGNFWHGGISHVAIYDYALTASQILNHYQVGSTLTTPPIMSIQLAGSNVIVNWTSGSLQAAPAVTGPWTNVTNAVSPYTVGATNSALFFRAKF